MIIDEDEVLRGDPYPEEAVPLVIFNEEKRGKCHIINLFILIFHSL